MGVLLEFRTRLRELVAAGEHHEAALLWGSVLEIQHYQPPPPGLIEGLPPGVLAVRTMPCSEVGCQGCLQGRWGFCFPFVGTYAGSSLVVAAGVSPAQAWDDFHSHEEPRLAAVDVLNLASGLWPTDLLPDHINKLLRHVESQSHPWGATPAQLWVPVATMPVRSGGSRPTKLSLLRASKWALWLIGPLFLQSSRLVFTRMSILLLPVTSLSTQLRSKWLRRWTSIYVMLRR
eukprot:s5591_g3.t1